MTETKQSRHVNKLKVGGKKRLDCYVSEAAKAELDKLCVGRGHRATIPEMIEKLIGQGIQLTAEEELQEQMKLSGKDYEHAYRAYLVRAQKELKLKVHLFREEIKKVKF